jgi:hypothetical protein
MLACWALTVGVFVACGGDDEVSKGEPVRGVGSATVGSAGGTIDADGLSLRIPANALSSPQTISVTPLSAPAPEAATAYSPVYRFEPEGLIFQTPIIVEMKFVGDAADATMFWTVLKETTFEEIGGAAESGTLRASVTHFSHGFVGQRRKPTTPVGPTNPEPTLDAASDGPADARSDTLQGGGGIATCTADGTCPVSMTANWRCCPTGGTGTFGYCRDLWTDEANCGACGSSCAAGQTCIRGANDAGTCASAP